MPLARPACFNNIGRIERVQALSVRRFALGELSKFFQFMRTSNTSSVMRKSWTKHIRHQHNIVLLTDWATHLCFIAKVSCSTHQVWVRITHLIAAQSAATKFINHDATTKTVINDTANCFPVIASDAERTQPTDATTHEHVSER